MSEHCATQNLRSTGIQVKGLHDLMKIRHHHDEERDGHHERCDQGRENGDVLPNKNDEWRNGKRLKSFHRFSDITLRLK